MSVSLGKREKREGGRKEERERGAVQGSMSERREKPERNVQR